MGAELHLILKLLPSLWDEFVFILKLFFSMVMSEMILTQAFFYVFWNRKVTGAQLKTFQGLTPSGMLKFSEKPWKDLVSAWIH